MTAEQTIAKLQAAQGDPKRLALVTLDIVLSPHEPERRHPSLVQQGHPREAFGN
jgi:hypothetical protein